MILAFGLFSCRSAHVPAAVDVDRLASDVAIGGQHDHHVGHFVHGAQSAHRNQVWPARGLSGIISVSIRAGAMALEAWRSCKYARHRGQTSP